MILVDSDFNVVKMVVARRKHNAGMAELEHTSRTGEYAGESPATGSTFEDEEE
jgi:hypothetical protein